MQETRLYTITERAVVTGLSNLKSHINGVVEQTRGKIEEVLLRLKPPSAGSGGAEAMAAVRVRHDDT